MTPIGFGVRHQVSTIRGGPPGRPAIWLAFALVLAGLGLAGCAMRPIQPETGSSVPQFTGVVKAACSPSDATAIQIDLVDDGSGPPRMVSISLWNTDLLDAPFVKYSTIRGGGAGQWCPTEDPCIRAEKGSVRFSGAGVGGWRTGSFRLETASGILPGTFQVQEDRQHPALCG